MKNKILYAFVIFASLGGCKNAKDEINPVGGGLQIKSGTIAGSVALFDTNNVQLQDQSGVRVTLLKYDSFDTTITDSSGHWEFKSVATGGTILFMKNNYFMEQIKHFQYEGDGTFDLGTTILFHEPTYTIEDIGYAYNSSDTSLTIWGIVSNESASMYKSAIICFDTSYRVAPFNGYFFHFAAVSCPINSNICQYKLRMNSAFKLKYGFKTGTKIYISINASSPFAPNYFFDEVLGKLIPQHFAQRMGFVGIPEITIP